MRIARITIEFNSTTPDMHPWFRITCDAGRRVISTTPIACLPGSAIPSGKTNIAISTTPCRGERCLVKTAPVTMLAASELSLPDGQSARYAMQR